MKALLVDELMHVFSLALGPEGDLPAWGRHRGGDSTGVMLSSPVLGVQGLTVTVNAFEKSLQWFKSTR